MFVKVLNFEYPRRYALSSIDWFIFKYPDLIPLKDNEKNLTKYARISPITDPMNKGLKLAKPNAEEKVSLSHDMKVIKATANITPGIAYPDIEKALLNLLHTSGYPNIKFEKKVDFEELYNQKFN